MRDDGGVGGGGGQPSFCHIVIHLSCFETWGFWRGLDVEGGDRNGAKRKLNRMVVVVSCQMGRKKIIFVIEWKKVLDNRAAAFLLTPPHIISAFIRGVDV